MTRAVLDDTIARLELEKRVIDVSIGELKRLREAQPKDPPKAEER